MLRAICRFEKDKFLHSRKLIVPFLLLVLYIGMAYTIAPLDILDSYSICSLLVFILMLSIGIMYDDINYEMIDQSILVRLHNKKFFYLGKLFMMSAVSLVFAAISVFLPIVIDLINHFEIFTRSVLPSDLLSGLILFWLAAMSGGTAGLLMNHRIISRREWSILGGALFGLCTIFKGGINDTILFAKWITWVLPPIDDLSFIYCRDVYFQFRKTWFCFVWLFAYIILESALYIKIMLKKGIE